MLSNPQQPPILAGFTDPSISTYHTSTDVPPESTEPYNSAEYIEGYSLRQATLKTKLHGKHEGSQEEVVWIDHHPPPKDKKHDSLL